jgi:hypothetical protein
MDNLCVYDAADPGILSEPNWGNANLQALPSAERRKRSKRNRARADRWAKAAIARGAWSPEQFADEERRIAAQIAEWERQRNAA